MSTEHTTRVESTQGITHTGDGHIYVSLGAAAHEPRKPVFRKLPDDQLRWTRRVLVAPVNMGGARTTLEETGTVILDGAPGSGRSATARVLLREHHRPGGAFRELLPDELPLRDPYFVDPGDRLLLDLSTAEAGLWRAVRDDLPALRQTVHERRAHLVVVMPHDGALESDLQHYRVEIGPPAFPMEVLRRHLRAHGVPYEEFLRNDVTVDEFLSERKAMREIADFADRIRRARETAGPGEGFTEWCAAAKRARAGRRVEVADRVAGLPEASQRALLIAVSMLHGAHADVVHRAAALLLSTVGTSDEETPLLQRKDLAQRLSEISARSGPDGRVRFTELDYDSAVRAHFWDHMPDLRPHLGAWAARVVESNDPHLVPDVRDGLVARLAGEYLRTGRADALAALAERWSAERAGRARLEASVQALTCGLAHPAHGRDFRERIYQWCAHRRLTGEFAQVLVQVCSDVLALDHPDHALIRLHHLARRERGTAHALQALCALVAGSRRLRRRLLDRLARGDLAQTDLSIFLHVSDPEPLTDRSVTTRALVDEEGVRRSLITCWRAVLTDAVSRPQGRRVAPQAEIQRWLHWAAEGAGDRGEVLLDLLVDAADRCGEDRGATFAVLYASARQAEGASPGGGARSAETTDLLLYKIGVAQGLGHGAPSASAGEGR
ncbi:hypothetical protein HCJ76_11835 [Streptomyces sp. MC1]|uniref:hypothetical protein n=1 Tax=Streptomyces sp. MC1 TaxID=295105 RepID=UPI0018CA7321|nr:hypothetical protein [Streptomyces sp. MC1]MBG7698745.1 hypothetical protein [Streptomyces sp. MC1]